MRGQATNVCGEPTRSGGTCKKPAGWGTNHLGEGACRTHGGKGNGQIKHGLYSRYSAIKRPRIRELVESFANDPDPLDLLPEINMLRALVIDYIERYDEYTEALLAWHSSFNPDFADDFADWRAARVTWGDKCRSWLDKWEEYRQHVESIQHHYKGGWPEPPDVEAFPRPPSPPDPADYASKPRQLPDVLAVGKFLVNIGQLAERLEKRKESGFITMATLNAVLDRFGTEMALGVMETVKDEALRAKVLERVEGRWSNITLPGPNSPTG